MKNNTESENKSRSWQSPHVFATTTILMASWARSGSGQAVNSNSETSRLIHVWSIALLVSILHASLLHSLFDIVVPSAKGLEPVSPSLSHITCSEQGNEGKWQCLSWELARTPCFPAFLPQPCKDHASRSQKEKNERHVAQRSLS